MYDGISLKEVVDHERVQATGSATSCSATFRQLLRFWATFAIFGSFQNSWQVLVEIIFYFFCDIY